MKFFISTIQVKLSEKLKLSRKQYFEKIVDRNWRNPVKTSVEMPLKGLSPNLASNMKQIGSKLSELMNLYPP